MEPCADPFNTTVNPHTQYCGDEEQQLARKKKSHTEQSEANLQSQAVLDTQPLEPHRKASL